MHQNIHLHHRVLHGALVMLERSAVKVARCVLRGERSREAPDLPGGVVDEVTPRKENYTAVIKQIKTRVLKIVAPFYAAEGGQVNESRWLQRSAECSTG